MQAMLSAIMIMLQPLSVTVIPDPNRPRLKDTPPPDTVWTRDYTIEVSEAEGLPRSSKADVLKACNGSLDCASVTTIDKGPHERQYVKVDPLLGVARRVTVRAQSTTAMERAAPQASALADAPFGGDPVKAATYDWHSYNVLYRTRTPDWIEQPPADEIESYTPSRADHFGISGAVAVECIIKADRKLGDCDPVSAYPADLGFENAGARLAGVWFKVKEGAPSPDAAVGAKVRLRIDFPSKLRIPLAIP